MFRQGSILGSTFFASREPVRDPEALRVVRTCRDLASTDPSMAGSMGLRRVKGLLLTTDVGLATLSTEDVVEVMEYDPVRKTSIAVGMKEPTTYVPLHWLGLRTHPGNAVTLLLFMEAPPKGAAVFSSRLLHGSFEEAMEVMRAMKDGGHGAIFLDGRGLFLVSRDLESVGRDLAKAMGLPRKADKGRRARKAKKGKAGSRRKGGKKLKGMGPAQRRRRAPARKTHYKRGATRRRTKGGR